MAQKENSEITPLREHIKNISARGAVLTEKELRLAERLLNTRGFKQDPQIVREEGRKMHQVTIYGPGRGIRGKGRLLPSRLHPGEQVVPVKEVGVSQSWDPTEKMSPQAGWGWLGLTRESGKAEGIWWAEAATTDTSRKEHTRVQNPDGSQPTPSTEPRVHVAPAAPQQGRGWQRLAGGRGGQ